MVENDGDSATKELRPGYASRWREGIGGGAVLVNSGAVLDNTGAVMDNTVIDDAAVAHRREEESEVGAGEAQTNPDTTGLLKNRTIARAFQILMKPKQARQMV